MVDGLGMALFSVVIGAPALASQLPDGCNLLVEADDQRLQAIRQDVQASGGSPVLLRSAVLSACSNEPLHWHRYSDGRLDGPTAPERWASLFPNLQHLGSEERPGVALAELLSSLNAEIGPSGLSLSIRQGDPVAILRGTGEWLGKLEQVELTAPKAEQLWGEATGHWLAERGFEPEAGGSLRWKRHPLMAQMQALQAERDGLAVKVGELETQLNSIAAAIDEALQAVG